MGGWREDRNPLIAEQREEGGWGGGGGRGGEGGVGWEGRGEKSRGRKIYGGGVEWFGVGDQWKVENF